MKKEKIIDLTCKISEKMAVFPGDPRPELKRALKMPRDCVNILSLKMATHHGTHIDAPYHKMIKGRKLDSYPLGKFLLKKACRIDLRKVCKRKDKKIEVEDLIPFKKVIRKNKAVLLFTGHNMKNNKNFPYLSENAAKFLSKFNLDIVGIDTLSVDSIKSKDKAHLPLLKRDILILETLANLKKLPKEFILICAPLLIENSDGAPCRVAALI